MAFRSSCVLSTTASLRVGHDGEGLAVDTSLSSGGVLLRRVRRRSMTRGGDVGHPVAVERPDEGGGIVGGLRGRVGAREEREDAPHEAEDDDGVRMVGRRGCRDDADDAEDVCPAVERAGEAVVEREGREERGLGDCRPGRVAETPARARRRLTASSVTSRGLRARSGAMRAKPRVAHMSSWSAAEWRTQWKTKSSAPRRCRVFQRPRGR